jgi:ABC-type phosphate/phosphonate transport system ATPase subunit
MPIEHGSWMLPAAEQAYKHRKEILSAWERLTAFLFGKRKAIAVTGMAGAGKTVLFDHLSGLAYKQGYTPPFTSVAVESGKLKSRKKRIGMSVIPGQSAPPRLFALNDIFLGKKPVNGVIHVVSNGFIELRSREAKETLIKTAGLATLEQS